MEPPAVSAPVAPVSAPAPAWTRTRGTRAQRMGTICAARVATSACCWYGPADVVRHCSRHVVGCCFSGTRVGRAFDNVEATSARP